MNMEEYYIDINPGDLPIRIYKNKLVDLTTSDERTYDTCCIDNLVLYFMNNRVEVYSTIIEVEFLDIVSKLKNLNIKIVRGLRNV